MSDALPVQAEETPSVPSPVPMLESKPRSPVLTVGISASILLLLFSAAWCWFGSVGALRTAMAGRHLYIPQSEIDMGSMRLNEVRKIEVLVQNVTRSSVKIAGSKTSCGCTVVADLPLEVPAYSSANVPIGLRGVEQGPLDVSVILFTVWPEEQPHIRLTGSVDAGQDSSKSNSLPPEPATDSSSVNGPDAP